MKYETGAKKHIAPSFDERFKRGSNSGSDTQQISSLFRQIGNHLGVADRQCKLKLVFQPGFSATSTSVSFPFPSGTSFITIFTIRGMSGSQISVMTRLNPVCAFAICREITSISFPFGEIN